MSDCAAAPSATVRCRLLLASRNSVTVFASGLDATFTLGEVLIIFGNRAVLDLCLHNEATLDQRRPIAWPLHLKHSGPVTASLGLPEVRQAVASGHAPQTDPEGNTPQGGPRRRLALS